MPAGRLPRRLRPMSHPAPRPAFDPRTVTTWIFDLDNTLYPAACNLFAQIDERMDRFIVDRFGLDREAAHRLRKDLLASHGTTMNGLMREHDVPAQDFLAFVHDIDLSPVEPSARLDAALHRLPGRKLVYTNGDVPHARRVLNRLGAHHHFTDIFDIVAADYVPKPDPVPYAVLIDRLGIAPDSAVMVEDMIRNLEPAAALGMTTIWVPSRPNWRETVQPPAYVHHVVEDLVDWLEQQAALIPVG